MQQSAAGSAELQHVLLLAHGTDGLEQVFPGLAEAGVKVTHWADLDLAGARPLRPPVDAVVCMVPLRDRRGDLVRSAISYSRVHDVPVLLLLREFDGVLPADAAAVDDFLFPPYRAPELLLRVSAALARRNRREGAHGLLHVGPVELDPATYRVAVEGHLVSLTFREFELLRYLMEHAGQYLTRDVLLDRVWGADYEGSLRTVDVHVWRLRTKLGLEGEMFIESLRGVGYRIREAPE